MQWFVYYLYSAKLGKYYIGKSNDVQRRLTEHNRGKEKYTSQGMPWLLAGYASCPDSITASNLEKKLKKSKNPKYVKWYIISNGKWFLDE